MANTPNNGKPISKGNASGGNVLPSSDRFPQPKAGNAMSGANSSVYPESAQALKALGLSQPIAKNRPKGL